MRILSLLIIVPMFYLPNRQPDPPHGPGFKISCGTCHSTKGWQLDKEIYYFDHNTTTLPLVGQHIEINCRQCHPTLVFSEAKTECNECHNDVHQATVGSDCSRCHTPSSWLVNNINEIHQMSRFPLIGAHRTADCFQCHKSESLARFDVPGVNCIDCHREDYMAATDPNHLQSGFPEDCSFCHPMTSFQWTGSSFTHDIFPLTQAHLTVQCAECHTTGRYSDANSDCYSCHQKDYLASKEPDHNASKLPTNCLDCHSIIPGWKPATLDHNSFPLTHGHAVPACIDCHTGGNYISTPTDCYSCHQQNYNSTTNPNHSSSGYPKVCETCHTTNPDWKPANFDHSSFSLTLGHSVPLCVDCHTGGNFTSTPTDCYSCHQKNYLSTTNPNHTTFGFSNTCTDCHTLNPDWIPTTFDHSSFPLKQGHSTPECIECHPGGNYASTSPDCYSCHQENYTSTTNPNHVASAISRTCESCHTLNPGWKPASFDHTGFPLTLGHSTPDCIDCHIGGNYTSTSTDCYSCHQQNYLSALNPNHSTSLFPKVCETCHTINPGWKPTTFNHSFFPLTLGHSTPACIDCHIGGNYTTTSTDCYACHQPEYLATSDPDHTLFGFSNVCQTCHTLNPGWKPSTFNHNSFPLMLGHSTPACIECHPGGSYATTPTDCYSCHQQDFLSTTDPNHSASGFTTTCQTCHSLGSGWKPTTFNHNSFPLTLGHSTPDCIDCHVGGNYTTTPTDCYSCHQQNYISTTNPNHSTSGFPTTCLTCHTTNPGWTPATFNHISFPLTLGHSTPACTDCHIGGNYTTTSPECNSCHLTDYNNTVNPNHQSLSFSVTCTQCHTTNPGWKPATYAQHDSQSFPIYSGTHNGVWDACTDCHTNLSNYSLFSCITCHEHNKTDMDNQHDGEIGYSYNSIACLGCHPQGRAD